MILFKSNKTIQECISLRRVLYFIYNLIIVKAIIILLKSNNFHIIVPLVLMMFEDLLI